MDKRGQFFLIAAIIIVGIVFGLAAVVNTVNTREENEYFYDLAQETGFETKKVLDHGTFNSFTANDFNRTLSNLLVEYANYIAHDQVIFIYGDASQLYGLTFQLQDQGSVGISTGGIPNTITIQYTTGRQADVQDHRNAFGEIESVTVEILETQSNENIIYDFQLREGENFFFLIIKEEEGEKYVAQG